MLDGSQEVAADPKEKKGVPQDYVQAHMWFNLAASLRLTGEFGVRNRDRVADRIDPRTGRRGTTPRSRVGRRAPA